MNESHFPAIRDNLFFAAKDYTKSFPDFAVPQKFVSVAPSEAASVQAMLRDSLADEGEVLLYVHLPFCAKECVFCNTDPRKAGGREQDAYLVALLAQIDMEADAGMYEGHPVRTIYFGGGTPTSYPPRKLGQILDKIRSRVTLADGCRITCEAHPRTLAMNDRIAELAAISDGGFLVNVSRGGVVDDGALAAEVAAGRLRAASDVLTCPSTYDDSEVRSLWCLPMFNKSIITTRKLMTELLR